MRHSVILCLLALVPLAGCSNSGGPAVNAGSPAAVLSPLVGKWSGKTEVKGGDLAKVLNSAAGGPLTGPSSLTLSADGTGFLKVADKPERPISWRQEGEKVLIQLRSVGSEPKTEENPLWVGTLSGDDKSMTIDMEEVKVKLSKAE